MLFLGMAGELADSGESLTVNGSASVVGSDIHTDNASVYIIDEVLHP